jgi:hypothetical protein
VGPREPHMALMRCAFGACIAGSGSGSEMTRHAIRGVRGDERPPLRRIEAYPGGQARGGMGERGDRKSQRPMLAIHCDMGAAFCLGTP